MRTPLHRRTEKIGACLADPFANGEGRIELIRSPSPKGAGGGCIDLVAILAQSPAQCQSKTYAGCMPIALGWTFAIVRETSQSSVSGEVRRGSNSEELGLSKVFRAP
jgi:hypothetical protein